MAITNPTTNYGWELPEVGGDIGIWGVILNRIIGNEWADPEVEESVAQGIDYVIGALQAEVDALELEVDDLDTRVTTIEASGAGATYARVNRSSDQSTPDTEVTVVQWENEDFDEGDLFDSGISATRLTVPSGASGLFEIRAALTMKSRATSDDSYRIQVEIRKTAGGTPETVALGFVPHLDDGFNADSGDITILVEAIDLADENDYYEVYVLTDEPGSSFAGTIRGGSGTYFEAVRIAPEGA